MGFISRLTGRKEPRPSVKAIILGTGDMAGRLAKAYKSCAGIEFMGIRPIDEADQALGIKGLQAVEIVAEPEMRAGIAGRCLREGLFTSLDAPHGLDEIEQLNSLAGANGTSLRFRLYPLYYPPYLEVKRLLDEDRLGMPLCLKLQVRRGRGTSMPEGLDPMEWILEHELGFLSLSRWLLGRIEKVYTRQAGVNPGSTLIMCKYLDIHRYGYLQLDFCPELHIRTFTEPVHRFLELASAGGIIMVTRGEGQMHRMPALIVRGKTTATSFEMVPDDWREVYSNLARETCEHLVGKKPMAPTTELAKLSIQLVRAAMESRKQGKEIVCL